MTTTSTPGLTASQTIGPFFRYGLAWQVTPDRLMQLMSSDDKAAAGRVMGAMMQMKKIDIAKLEEAAAAS